MRAERRTTNRTSDSCWVGFVLLVGLFRASLTNKPRERMKHNKGLMVVRFGSGIRVWGWWLFVVYSTTLESHARYVLF